MISKNTILACLTVSAIILTGMLVLEMVTEPNQAMAQVGATSRAGNFALCTASKYDGESLMWIANVNTQQLIVCEANYRGELEVLDSVDLIEVFGE